MLLTSALPILSSKWSVVHTALLNPFKLFLAMRIRNEGGCHNVVSQTEIKFCIYNSIYFALLVHRQEYRNELKENIYVNIYWVFYTTFYLSLWNHLVIPSLLFQHVSPTAISTIHGYTSSQLPDSNNKEFLSLPSILQSTRNDLIINYISF
jgi:hypothetical protein